MDDAIKNKKLLKNMSLQEIVFSDFKIIGKDYIYKLNNNSFIEITNEPSNEYSNNIFKYNFKVIKSNKGIIFEKIFDLNDLMIILENDTSSIKECLKGKQTLMEYVSLFK